MQSLGDNITFSFHIVISVSLLRHWHLTLLGCAAMPTQLILLQRGLLCRQASALTTESQRVLPGKKN